ncbi:MAG TPA: hypothetical protein DCM40_15305 [Maribacter sp.]|nr:hypothetical protein [Maribacter sp.]|tara:strand:+ start:596 stop:817 length:222 start_codon:yes stop_codon:yes gene_type:complete
MITMRTGDLIYIPQDVDLWDFDEETTGVKYSKTNKPTTGVFIKMDAFNTCRVFANGQEASVALKCIYPMEETC